MKQSRNAMRNHASFAATGTGENEERTFHELHCLLLGFIQAFEKAFREFGFHEGYYITATQRAGVVSPPVSRAGLRLLGNLRLQKRTKFDTITFRRIVTFFDKDVYEIKTVFHRRNMSATRLDNTDVRPEQ